MKTASVLAAGAPKAPNPFQVLAAGSAFAIANQMRGRGLVNMVAVAQRLRGLGDQIARKRSVLDDASGIPARHPENRGRHSDRSPAPAREGGPPGLDSQQCRGKEK